MIIMIVHNNVHSGQVLFSRSASISHHHSENVLTQSLTVKVCGQAYYAWN